MVLCKIYRSVKRGDYYLFVKQDEELSRVPETLLDYFGERELAMTLALTPDRKLALVSAPEVLDALEVKGYYLQMPPPSDAYMTEVRGKNEKL